MIVNQYHRFFRRLQVLFVGILFSSLLFIAPVHAVSSATVSPERLNQLDTSLQQEIEKERQQATAEAESKLDREAIAAIEETKKAIAAIERGKTQEAIAALERATGKIDILVAQYPKLALIPVAAQVAIVDFAPQDFNLVDRIRKQVKGVAIAEDFPAARELLNNLISEIRTAIVNLPLERYPDATKQAARLLNEGKIDEAKGVLQLALSTLVVTEQARPLPLVKAHTDLVTAVTLTEKDRDAAQRLLEDARTQLKLAQELGYARGDREYAAFDKAIKNLERQVKARENTAGAFAKLQEQFSSFFNRVSEVVKPGDSSKRAEARNEREKVKG
jgi:ribosome-associated translation inhibitor RaiA